MLFLSRSLSRSAVVSAHTPACFYACAALSLVAVAPAVHAEADVADDVADDVAVDTTEKKPEEKPEEKPVAASTAKPRDLITDRPDTTESPYTVPMGFVQMEMEFFTLSQQTANNVSTQNLDVLTTNFKAGLSDNIDLQVGVNPAALNLSAAAGDTSALTLGGDVTVRLKMNLWGNDEGDTALGLMPYITFPMSSLIAVQPAHLQGGLIVPLTLQLPADLSFSTMLESDLVFDEAIQKYQGEFLVSGSLGIPLFAGFGAYLEGTANMRNVDFAGTAVTANAGLTYMFGDSWQWDAGMRFRVLGDVEDYVFFTGVSTRIDAFGPRSVAP